MIRVEDIMGTKEAADLLRVSPQAFSNLRSRYKDDFPKPRKELSATPIYDREELESWAEKHFRKFHAKETVPVRGRYKTIAFCGRPRTGKSFLVSMFSENPCLYRAACSKPGDDFTQCAVQHIIRENIEPHAVFHDKRKGKQGENEYGMDGIECPITDERFSDFMDEIASYLKEKRREKKNVGDMEYLEIFMRPSWMARSIMRACDIQTLIVTDTPGVSGNYELVPIEKADMVALVMNDANQTEAQDSFGKLVEGLAPLVASSEVCFLYRINTPCDDEEEYEELQQEAKEAMDSFAEYFEDWQGKGSVLETTMDILQPAKTVIGIPSMKPKKRSSAEDIFTQYFEKKILDALLKKPVSADFVKHAVEEANVEKDRVIAFVKELLGKWQYESLVARVSSGNSKYTLENFKREKHDRVKSGDDYRLLWQAGDTCRRELKDIYDTFCGYTIDNCPEAWKQSIVKYAYEKLTSGIKTDCGVGVGEHPFEDTPPVTMYVIESILAEEIYANILDGKGVSEYVETMKSYGVSSNSWNYVSVNLKDTDAVKKLELLVKSGLSRLNVSNLSDLVWSRYVMGLQKMAEYYLWREIGMIVGMSEEEVEENMHLINRD
ncbi:MAG: hypothetical protein Q4E24_05305 [bacterium]|nr:hypothetical protein [bacterium]